MSAAPPQPLVALLTDFGLADWFVGVLHAEILARVPQARIIDLTHRVPPGQVAAGAFALQAALASLPQGTVVCGVVDPGVGTARRALCGRIGEFYWSGPDNGLATPLLLRAAQTRAPIALHDIVHPPWRKPEASRTFHGRDLFAPAAANLARGADFTQAGPPVPEPVRLAAREPRPLAPGHWSGEVLWIDHFGNLITNFAAETFAPRLAGSACRVVVQGSACALAATSVSPTYGGVPPGSPVAYWGSTGHLELALNGANAAQHCGAESGAVADLWV